MRPRELAHTPAGSVGLFGVAATAVVGLVDPAVPGRYPPCPFLLVTGLACPFCGGLRATHALLHGDLHGSWEHHQLLLPILAFALGYWAVWLRRTIRRESPRAILPRWSVWAICLVLGGYGVARQFPALGLPPLPR